MIPILKNWRLSLKNGWICSSLACLFMSNCYSQIISTYAGNGQGRYCGEGIATNACLNFPWGLAIDKTGNLFVCDVNNERIRKITPQGIISTIAGNGNSGFGGDGGQAVQAQLNYCTGLALDYLGNIYLADAQNNRIRKIDNNGVITTVAGNGQPGYNGDGIPATTARLYSPMGVACDKMGNLFVADFGNKRVRKIDLNGIISTYGGNGTNGLSGDGGQATLAQLTPFNAIGIDDTGNIYIGSSDSLQVYCRIRKIDTAGIINRIVGDSIGFSGDGGLALNAKFSGGTGISFDKQGNFYFVDGNNYRIRMVNQSGIISSVAGNGMQGFSGDGGPPLFASIYSIGLVSDSTGNLYISDSGNERIRKVDKNLHAGESQQIEEYKSLQVYPNPSTGTMYISGGNISDKEWQVEVLDVTGRVLLKQTVPVNKGVAVLDSDLPPGAYFVALKGSYGNSLIKKVMIAN